MFDEEPDTPAEALAKIRAASALAKIRAKAPEAPPISHVNSGSWGDIDNADTSALGNVSRAVLQGATLGAGNKIVAGGNAVLDAMRGGKFGEAYKERLAGERAASKQFGEQHPAANLGLEVAGGVGSMVASGGFSAPTAIGNISRAARIGKGIANAATTGFDLGAASGAINADGDLADKAKGAMRSGVIGGAGGAVLSPVMGGVGYLAGKARVPQGMSYLADKASSMLPAGSAMRRWLENAAGSFGTRGQAATQIGERMQMDEAAGFQPPQHPSNVPALALDRGGSNIEGLAKGVVRRPGVGGSTIRTALAERDAGMRPAVTQAFDQETGTTAAQGEQLLQQLTDEQDRADRIAAIRKAVTRENVSARAAQPDPAVAWHEEAGQTANGIAELRRMVGERSAEAQRLFGAARQATQGQAIQSPTLDEVLKTPAGRTAFGWARMQKGNRGSPLPTVPTEAPAPSGFSPEQWTALQDRMRAKGMEVPGGGTQELPDPETLHYMKQALAKMARLGVNDGTGGTTATQAQGALQVWGNVRNELPEVWRHADDAFTAQSRLIDMLNAGRGLMRTQLNPAGRGQKALYNSLDAIEQRVAGAEPEEQHAFRVGAQSAVSDFFRAGGSSTGFARQMADPTSVMSRRVALAMGDPAGPQRIAARLTSQPQHLLAPPPEPSFSPESQASRLGLDVLRHGESAPGNAPERSLAVLQQTATNMAPSARASLQRGAAQAVRGEWRGASNSVRSPGRTFNTSPERAEQVGYAFPSPESASRFQGTVRGWDDLTARSQRITGGSDTAGNLAEEAQRGGRASALRQLLTGNPGHALAAVGTNLAHEAESKARQGLDAEIARVLSSRDPQALKQAMNSAEFRQRLNDMLHRGLGAGSALVASQP